MKVCERDFLKTSLDCKLGSIFFPERKKACQSVFLKGGTRGSISSLEMVWRGLEVLSHSDGAWYDVDCRRSSVVHTPKGLKVRIRFSNFPAEDQEFFSLPDLDAWFRLRSRPWDENACGDIKAGANICAFAEFDAENESKWMDAVVEDVRRVEHSEGSECGCQFKVRWIETNHPLAPNWKILEPRWLNISAICAIQHSGRHLAHPFIMKWKREIILGTGTEVVKARTSTRGANTAEPWGEESASTCGVSELRHKKHGARTCKADNENGQSKELIIHNNCTPSASFTHYGDSKRPADAIDLEKNGDGNCTAIVLYGEKGPDIGSNPRRARRRSLVSPPASPCPLRDNESVLGEGSMRWGFVACARMMTLDEIRMEKKHNWKKRSVRTPSSKPPVTPCGSMESSDGHQSDIMEEKPSQGSHGKGLKRKAHHDDEEMNSPKRALVTATSGQNDKSIVLRKSNAEEKASTQREHETNNTRGESSPNRSDVGDEAGGEVLEPVSEVLEAESHDDPSETPMKIAQNVGGKCRDDCEAPERMDTGKQMAEDVANVEGHLPTHLPTQVKEEDEKILNHDFFLIEGGESDPDDEVVLVMDGSVKVSMEEDTVAPPSGSSGTKADVWNGLESIIGMHSQGCVDVDPCIPKPVGLSVTSQPENVETYKGLEVLCAAAFSRSLKSDITLPPMQRYKRCAKQM
ncbi:hypothetical protein BSKO_01615 [Bryopsis sp. KO-2023]|nr:hypothetical protein BSKO_01615 [Bryopsis sp. KO-2023]